MHVSPIKCSAEQISKLKEYPLTQPYVEWTAVNLRKVLFTSETTQIWLDHHNCAAQLEKRSKESSCDSASKEASSSCWNQAYYLQLLKKSLKCYCGQCTKAYKEIENEELWIRCDVCNK